MLYYSIAHYYDRQGSRNEIKYDNIKKTYNRIFKH